MTVKYTKVMIFGTFDGLHLGHLNLFKQARGLAKNSFLIVSVARDINVKKIKKIKTDFTERQRMNLIKKTKLADKVVLGGLNDHVAHILKEKPEIIALGYDQRNYVKNLKADLKKKGLLVTIKRLKPYKAHIYKNHLLKNAKN